MYSVIPQSVRYWLNAWLFKSICCRVLPETSVAMLRQEISEQLGNEIFPEDYVFLKHIGRCLALVRIYCDCSNDYSVLDVHSCTLL